MHYLVAFLSAFFAILLKVFQQKNVVGNHYKAAFVTSLLLTACEATIILVIVAGGVDVIIPTGLGSALGGITGMWLHNAWRAKVDK